MEYICLKGGSRDQSCLALGNTTNHKHLGYLVYKRNIHQDPRLVYISTITLMLGWSWSNHHSNIKKRDIYLKDSVV